MGIISAVVVLLLTLVGSALGDSQFRRDSSCPAGNVCFWSGHGTNAYENNKQTKSNTNPGWHPIGITAGSLKNAYGNRKVSFAESDSPNLWYCVDAGENRPDLTGYGNITYYNIGNMGSDC